MNSFYLVIGPLIILSSLLTVTLIIHAIVPLLPRKSSNHAIFLITIPQYGSKEQAEHQLDIKKRLAMIEGLFASLASIRAQRGVRAFLFGRSDHISLEIVKHSGLIRFYAGVPPHLTEFFIQQLHSAYPHANIEEVTDYNIFKPQSIILTGYLVHRRSFIYPIKTYTSFDYDPLETLTTALSKVPDTGGAAIQFVIRSAKKEWHSAGRRVSEKTYHGTSLREASRGLGAHRGIWSPLGEIIGGIFSVFGASFKSAPPEKKPNELQQRYQPSQKEQESIKGIEDKTSKAGFDVNIRLVVALPNVQLAQLHLRNVMDAFGQFNIYEYGNAFKPLYTHSHTRVVEDFIYRNFNARLAIVLNSEEMVSLFHLPEQIHAPSIGWLAAKRLAPPSNMPTEGILLGHSQYRGSSVEVRLKDDDRRRHVYLIGQTGTGKSTLLKIMALQDIRRGKGVCIIDPHGDLIEHILGQIPTERAQDVIVFNPADTERPMGLNMLEYDMPEQKTFVINEMINIFDKLYDLRQTGGPMFEQYMRNTMLLMMEDPASGSTLMEIPKVLADEQFRKYKLSKAKNPVVKDFWVKEAQKAGGEAALANMVPYITSKLTQFVSNDIMRPIIAQQQSSFNFRRVMDEQKILLINLSKGRIGDMNSSLLGMVIVGKLLMAALSRVDIDESQRNDFYLYIDEFQNYTTDSISIILSEARKYRLSLTIAHQYLGQLVTHNDTRIKDAVFGNVGTIIAYRVGVEDAETFAEQFAPTVTEYDVMNIEKFNAYIRILVDNQNPPAFNFRALAPDTPDPKIAHAIKEFSRMTYGSPREVIERQISERTQLPPVDNRGLPPVA